MEIIYLAVLLGPMFLLMGFGMPIFMSMAVACAITIIAFDMPFMVMAKGYVRGLDHYSMLAVPFYFLAGELMNQGGITRRLLDFSMAIVGHVRGGLSHVNIVASMIFSGVSGSGAADVSAIGSVLIPAMKKQGYSGGYSAAVTGASAMIGPIIPPSIPLVLFGLVAQVSVGKLFLAGVVPGVLMGIYLLFVSYLISHRRNYPYLKRAGLKKILRSGVDAVAALVMPIIIVGGISFGVVTPTEAGGIAVAYGLIAGMIFYRELGISDLPNIFAQSFLNSGSLLIVIATTGIFSWVVASIGVAETMVDVITSFSQTPWVILLILNVFFLILGCFLEFPITMFVVIPMFIPALEGMGINMIHFGVVVIMNLMIGALTPPFGIVIFLTSALAKTKIESVILELVPFLIALIAVLALCTFVPQLVLWLPNHL